MFCVAKINVFQKKCKQKQIFLGWVLYLEFFLIRILGESLKNPVNAFLLT
jgi:hypothetical protein